MASKVISLSLSESMLWKLEQLKGKSGISKSGLIQQALLLLFGEYSGFNFPGGSCGEDITREDIEAEYKEREQPTT